MDATPLEEQQAHGDNVSERQMAAIGLIRIMEEIMCRKYCNRGNGSRFDQSERMRFGKQNRREGVPTES